MEEKKYYTPEVEEFHVGFIFEYLYRDKWEESNDFSLSFLRDDTDTVSETLDGIKRSEIRVKYLDKEDIEAEGWVTYGGDPKTFAKISSRGESYFLHLKPEETKVLIRQEMNAGFEGLNILFQGVIRNKSELRRILKMIGVCI